MDCLIRRRRGRQVWRNGRVERHGCGGGLEHVNGCFGHRLVVEGEFRFGRDDVLDSLDRRRLTALLVVAGFGFLDFRTSERLRRPLSSAALPPFLRVGGRNRCLENLAPVEVDVWILLFELAADVLVERLASDFYVRRRAKPVQHTRRGPATALGGMNEVEVLVAAFVASEAEKCHRSQLSALSSRLSDLPHSLLSRADSRELTATFSSFCARASRCASASRAPVPCDAPPPPRAALPPAARDALFAPPVRSPAFPGCDARG
jgi:hypothetical protein